MESDIKLEVRQSKAIVMTCVIGWSFFEILLWGLYIYILIDIIIKNENGQYNNDIWADIFGLSCGVFIALLFLIILAYVIYCYRHEIDIYTEDKMYHTRNKKIIYELEYKDIAAIREGVMCSFIMFCEKPIVKKNGKLRGKTVWEYYKKADRIRIMQIISKNYPNINIISFSNINSDKN